ncbi:TerC family protein [Crocinitomicaceae bacterium]|jgi:tellurite resistance protein TerC|nr:TerC family protein [Crocinitomicaceae bacterium]
MIWILFLILVFALLALDLGVFHKENHKVSMKESLKWASIWVTLALLFGIVVYWIYDVNWFEINKLNTPPGQAMLDYYTGYLIEESLSLDNIFVIALVFKYFKIEGKFQHNILFWGIIGAVVFRLIMILVGAALVHNFEWITYVFGGILVYSALKMIFEKEESEDFKEGIAVRLLSKVVKIDWTIRDGRYFFVHNGKRVATAFFAALIVVEFSDIIFAVDSIPAIFSITKDPFIVFTSNIFAILGLRNLYFFLAGMMDKFHYMKYALIGVLLFVGTKMLIVHFYKISTPISLFTILGCLVGGVIFSIYKARHEKA